MPFARPMRTTPRPGPGSSFPMRTGMWDSWGYTEAELNPNMLGARTYPSRAGRAASGGRLVSDPNAPGWGYEARTDGSFRVVAAPPEFRSSVGHVLRPGSPGYDELRARLSATSFSADPLRFTHATAKAFQTGGAKSMEGWSRVGSTAVEHAPEILNALSHVKVHKNAQKQISHLQRKLARVSRHPKHAKHRAHIEGKLQGLQAQADASQAAAAQAGVDVNQVPDEAVGGGLPSWLPFAAAGGVALLLVLMMGGK